MKNKKSIIAALSLAAMFGMSSAHATPVTFNFDGFEVTPQKTVKVDHPGRTSRTVPAGMYNLSDVSGLPWSVANSPILAFCVELEESIHIGSTYTFELERAEDVLNGNSVASINRLLSSLSDFNFTNHESAIVQASIWELVYDQALPGDLGNGDFKLITGGTASVPDVNTYLDAANDYTGALKYELFVLQRSGNQDLLIWREVSAPSAFALFLVMAGLVLVRTRKA